jgi:hypothetical protein
LPQCTANARFGSLADKSSSLAFEPADAGLIASSKLP